MPNRHTMSEKTSSANAVAEAGFQGSEYGLSWLVAMIDQIRSAEDDADARSTQRFVVMRACLTNLSGAVKVQPLDCA